MWKYWDHDLDTGNIFIPKLGSKNKFLNVVKQRREKQVNSSILLKKTFTHGLKSHLRVDCTKCSCKQDAKCFVIGLLKSHLLVVRKTHNNIVFVV